jgi:hypothetical protein
MFKDNQKKNYSEMAETELNIDENYLGIFQDELNNILGNGLKKNVFTNEPVDNIINTKNKIIQDKIIGKSKPDDIIGKSKPDDIIGKSKPDNIIDKVENEYLKKKTITKNNNNIIKTNLKYTKKLFNKIKKKNTSKSTGEIKNNNNDENNINNITDSKIILNSKDILAIETLIKYLNNKF